MTKKVTFATKPKKNGQPKLNAESWVETGKSAKKGEEDLTRFTIDIPTELHVRIKSQCALRRVKMRDEIQALLEKHFPTS